MFVLGNLLVAFSALSMAVHGFSFGAPQSVCSDPYPHHHHISRQTSPPPYEISLSNNTYSPGDSITVTINATSEQPFVGFQIAAHSLLNGSRWDQLVGEFMIIDPAASKAQRWFSDSVNCVTHTNNKPKQSIQMEWKAPLVPVGGVVFSATVILNFETFWIDVSAELQTSETADSSFIDKGVSMSARGVIPMGADSCGGSTGCIYYPSFCSIPHCDYLLSYTVSNDQQHITFQMEGTTTGYLALGISVDELMEHDEVLTCFHKPTGQLEFQLGFNPAKHYAKNYDPKTKITDVAIQLKDGRFYCRFTRPMIHTFKTYSLEGDFVTRRFDLHKPHFLYLGWGDIYEGSVDSLAYHTERPIISAHPINVANPSVSTFTSLPVLVKVHATFGIVAWLGCISIAVVVARYYRSKVFNKETILGVKAWFGIHRGLSMFGALLTAVAFVEIFSYLKHWKESVSVHAWFGVAVMTLTVFEVFLAMARPDPSSDMARNVFNWVHRIAGVLTLGGGLACCMLGANIPAMPDQYTTISNGLMGFGIALVVFTIVLLQILDCRRGSAQKFEKTDSNGETFSIDERKPKPKDRKQLILYLFMFMMVALVTVEVLMTWLY